VFVAYRRRTFPVLRQLLPGCPSSCDVYVALDKSPDRAYYTGDCQDEDDSNEDGSDEGGSDKDASEEDDEDASEDEGGWDAPVPFEEESAYFQTYRGPVLPLTALASLLENLDTITAHSSSLIEKRLERITI
jgi:hypothetical protein